MFNLLTLHNFQIIKGCIKIEVLHYFNLGLSIKELKYSFNGLGVSNYFISYYLDFYLLNVIYVLIYGLGIENGLVSFKGEDITVPLVLLFNFDKLNLGIKPS